MQAIDVKGFVIYQAQYIQYPGQAFWIGCPSGGNVTQALHGEPGSQGTSDRRER